MNFKIIKISFFTNVVKNNIVHCKFTKKIKKLKKKLNLFLNLKIVKKNKKILKHQNV